VFNLVGQQVPLLRQRAELPGDIFVAALAGFIRPLLALSGTFATLICFRLRHGWVPSYVV